MKRYIIAGNWKMNKTIAETQDFMQQLVSRMPKTKNEVVVCPSYLSIQTAVEQCDGSKIRVGAQNLHYAQNGIFTGEISAEMLKEVGATYVIVGHSSRREFDNDTDEKINLKIKTALNNGLIPILCIGETAKQREANRTYRVLKKQLSIDLEGVEDISQVVIAYEPLWAISDGVNPAPIPTIQEIATVNSGIKRVLRQMFGKDAVKKVKILYGGSVGANNVAEIISERSVSGVLVGGASLNVDKFLGIIENSNK